MENKIFNEPTQNIDPATGFVVGSEEYNRAHNLIKDDHLTILEEVLLSKLVM